MSLLLDREPLKFFDPIHGFIHLDAVESAFIRTPYFDRLRYIHQLGLAFWVYPGGRASRFEHACGVMHLASTIFDQVIKSPYGIACGLSQEEIGEWRRVLRLAALAHDLGHLPFSHHAEKALLGERGHEAITAHIISHMDEFFTQAGIKSCAVLKLALGPKQAGETLTPWERLLSSIITSDFCGADRMDYLLRDAYTTGLAHGRFDYKQLIDKLCIVEGDSLGIYASGIESIESLLVARYFMYKRLYYHPLVRTYAMHVSHVMEEHFPEATDMKHFLSLTDMEILAFIRGSAPGGVHLEALRRPEQCRFTPLEIALKGKQEEIDKELQALDVDPTLVEIKYSTKYERGAESSFPVLLESGALSRSDKLSPLLSSGELLKGHKYWIFAHPKVTDPLLSYTPQSFEWLF